MNQLKRSLLVSAAFLGTVTMISGIPITKIKNSTLFTKVSAVVMGAIVPGQSYTTGNTTYGTSDLTVASNWTLKGATGTPTPTWSSNWINMTPNAQNQQAWGTLNYAFDMTQPVSFTGSIKAAGNVPATTNSAGDYLGVIFTPVNQAQAMTGGGSYNLGIAGLPNSIFAGRDYYYNSNVGDNSLGSNGILNALYPNSSNQIRIATTDSSGNLTASGSTASGVNPVSQTAINTAGDTLSIQWTPTSTNASLNQVTGTLTMTINGTTVTYTNLTMQQSMTFGVGASTGGNYSAMSVSFNGGSLSATKATTTATINYVNQATGNPIASPSYVKGNIGDSIGVDTSGESYDYTAPANLSGYHLSTTLPTPIILAQTYGTTNANVINVPYIGDSQTQIFNITPPLAKYGTSSQQTQTSTTGQAFPTYAVPQINGYISYVDGVATTSFNETADNTSNGASSIDSSPQTHNVTYTAITQTANFNFAWASDVPGTGTNQGTLEGTLPTSIVETGLTDTTINAPGLTIPSGYYLSSVQGSDGITYTGDNALADALSANPTYSGSIANNFTLTLSASVQSASLVTTNPDGTVNMQMNTGETGGDFTFTSVPQAITDSQGRVYYAVVTNPDGTTSGSSSAPADTSAISGTYDKTNNGSSKTDQQPQNYTVNYVLSDESSDSESTYDEVSDSISDTVSEANEASDSLSDQSYDSTSDSTSVENQESDSTFHSALDESDSTALSESEAGVSESESTSGYDEASDSLSDSTEISESAYDSLSDVVSDSDSISNYESNYDSASDSASNVQSESLSDYDSSSDSLSDLTSESESDSLSDLSSESLSDSTEISESAYDSLSDVVSDSDSVSNYESNVDSASDSASNVQSESLSDYDSASDSLSDLTSESESDSLSDLSSESESNSLLDSTSESESESLSDLISEFDSEISSESDSTSDSELMSESEWNNTLLSEIDSISEFISESDAMSDSSLQYESEHGSESISALSIKVPQSKAIIPTTQPSDESAQSSDRPSTHSSDSPLLHQEADMPATGEQEDNEIKALGLTGFALLLAKLKRKKSDKKEK
ncbi:MAG: hypothetical protein FWF14_01735 [Streptococcaceae bacterium]|nr:hypothetical protein [Streptococcaceae bacterium]